MAKYLRIYGEVGKGDSAAGAFIAAMDAVPASQAIYVSINSPGGSYFDGLSIFNAVRRRGNVTAIVEGLAASAASLIAMAAKRIVMAPGSMIMIHSPMTNARGNPAEIEKSLNTLRKIEADMAKIYSERAYEMTVAEALVLMRAESWLDAQTTYNLFKGVEIDENKIAASISPEWLEGYRNVPLALTLGQHVKQQKAPLTDSQRDSIRARNELKRRRLKLEVAARTIDPFAADLQRRRRRLELHVEAARLREVGEAEAAREADERDMAARAEAKAALQQRYYDNWNHTPRGRR